MFLTCPTTIRSLPLSYEVVASDDRILVIRDTSHLTGGRTVTNDAERVIADLNRQGLLNDRRLLYYDSEGQLDELVHNEGEFLGFQFIQ